MGGEAEFKHYVPRLFELLVEQPGWTATNMLIGKLNDARWTLWRPSERNAITDFVAALWQWALSAGPDMIDASDILSGCGLVGIDSEPLLAFWRDDEGVQSARQLARLITHEYENLPTDLDRRWMEPVRRGLMTFLRDPVAIERLQLAFLGAPDGNEEIASAIEVLERFRD